MMKLLPNSKQLFALAFIISLAASAQAQSKFKVGFVKDSATGDAISGVLVTNQDNHQLVHTDDKGFFRIQADMHEILFFDKENYHFDTLRFTPMTTTDTVVMMLARLPNVLAGVTVTARGLTKYQQDSIKRRLDFESVAGPKQKTVAQSNSGAGVAINLDPLLKKNDKSKRRAYNTYDEIERTNYVEYRFSRGLVGGYTGLKGDALSDFIEKYRPSYDWLRKHTAEDDVFYYVNEKLKEYSAGKK